MGPTNEHQYQQLGVPELLHKLDMLYDKEEQLKKDINRLYLELQQLKDDKELLQNFIMHKSNKQSRMRKWY